MAANDDHKSKWYYLVNFIATALVTVIGFIIKSLEMQRFDVAQEYLSFMLYIFVVYIILRLPEIIERILYVFSIYIPKFKKSVT